MDYRTDKDDASYLRSLAEARGKDIPISPPAVLLERAADALGARAALELLREDHETLSLIEADAARMRLIALEFTKRHPDDPNARVMQRAARALAEKAEAFRNKALSV